MHLLVSDTPEVLLLVSDEMLRARDDARALNGLNGLVCNGTGEEGVSSSCDQ